MRIDYIKEFLSLSQTLNYTESAKLCFTTQSALSKHIQRLEQELGTQLFDRNRQHVELTPAGRDLAEQAKVLIAEHDRFIALAHAHSPSQAEHLTIGFLKGLCESALPRAREFFLKKRPHAQLDFIPLSYPEILPKLLDGTIDVAVGASASLHKDELGEHVKYIPFRAESVNVVAPKGHRLYNLDETPLSIKELNGEKVLTWSSDARLSDKKLVSDWIDHMGVNVNVVEKFSSLELLPIQLDMDKPIVLLPSHLKDSLKRSYPDKFCFRPIVEETPKIPFEIAWDELSGKKSTSTFASCFVDAYRSSPRP